MSTVTTDNLIIEKLNSFISRYYKNQLIKGVIYTTAILLSLLVVFSVSESFAYFSTTVRALLFWGYVLLFAAVCYFYITRPLLKMKHLSKGLSYEEAAVIVGRHFPQVSDQLLNLLQLRQMSQDVSTDLLAACIAQKTEALSPIPFASAIDFKRNRKYMKYALIPAVVLLLILIASPATIVGSSKRIINYGTTYQRPAPFEFVVESQPLRTLALHDFELRATTVGTSAPSEMYVILPQGRFKMHPVDRYHFSYTFVKPNGSVSFQLYAAGVISPEYVLVVLPEPTIVDFSIALTYPPYTRIQNDVVMNDGNLSLPRGTTVNWEFRTRDADSLTMIFDSQLHLCETPRPDGSVSIRQRELSSCEYVFFATNRYGFPVDTMHYSIHVQPDLPPLIMVAQSIDSLLPSRRLFFGRIKDDYGFSSLSFVATVQKHGDTTYQECVRQQLHIEDTTTQEFFYSFDLSEVHLSMGDKLTYYFEVCDNDAVDGFQCVRSQEFEEVVPTQQELRTRLEAHRQETRSNAAEALDQLKAQQAEIDEMLKQLLEKKEMTWQDRQKLQELFERQKAVQQELQTMRKEMMQSQQLENQYNEHSEELLEKQRELNRLMNEVLDDKMRQTLEEMEQLMKQLNRDDLRDKLENIQINNKDLENQIDRDLDLLHRLELEQRVESLTNQLDDLSEQEEKLAEMSESKQSDNQDLLNKQQELSKQYEELLDELRNIERDYKKLDESLDFQSDPELEQSIKEAQENSEQQLRNDKSDKAAKSQRKAASMMQRLSQHLTQQQQAMAEQDLAEDVSAIRQLLRNLLRLSFSQEELMGSVGSTLIQDPKYQDIVVNQSALNSDFRMVEDSLNAIARRQVQVAAVVSREVGAVNLNIKKSLSDLLQMNQSFYGNSKNTRASRSMQYAMTSLNNLSLVLAESLDKMQQDMMSQSQRRKGSNSRQKKGNQSCSSPGTSKPSPQSMRQMQEELNRQMEALKKQLDKEGKSNGEGRKRLGSNDRMSEEFARMAAQQEAIRRMMQKYGQEMKQNSPNNSELAKEIDALLKKMESTETDLVNKTISTQTMLRQQQIMTRMLEHEKADIQKEKEEKRESREAHEIPSSSLEQIEQWERLKQQSDEQLNTHSLILTPFYKQKVEYYLFR